EDAHVQITIFFTDREPAGPYSVTVPARRTTHVRFNDLQDPEPIPHDTEYASLIESDVPVVVRTRGSIPGRRRTPCLALSLTRVSNEIPRMPDRNKTPICGSSTRNPLGTAFTERNDHWYRR